MHVQFNWKGLIFFCNLLIFFFNNTIQYLGYIERKGLMINELSMSASVIHKSDVSLSLNFLIFSTAVMDDHSNLWKFDAEGPEVLNCHF